MIPAGGRRHGWGGSPAEPDLYYRPGGGILLRIFVDADACPVKDEIYRVAARYGLEVTLVAASWMRKPDDAWIDLKVVGEGIDVADDWIVEHVGAGDIVVTADIPLAARCLGRGATVIGSTGRPFTDDNIGSALATRGLLAELRDLGEASGGPPPFEKRDRSRFLQQLDESIHAIRRGASLKATSFRPPAPDTSGG